MLEVEIGLRDGGAVEGIRLDDVSARRQVVMVNLKHRLRLGEVEHVAVVLKFDVVLLEARAYEGRSKKRVRRGGRLLITSIVALLEFVGLECSTHCTVEDYDTFLEDLSQVRPELLNVYETR